MVRVAYEARRVRASSLVRAAVTSSAFIRNMEYASRLATGSCRSNSLVMVGIVGFDGSDECGGEMWESDSSDGEDGSGNE